MRSCDSERVWRGNIEGRRYEVLDLIAGMCKVRGGYGYFRLVVLGGWVLSSFNQSVPPLASTVD
jgi:hypothetical protein